MSRPCLVCEADTNAFLCKVCLGEIRRAIAEMPSLRYEVSLLATGQTRVYRANSSNPEPPETWDDEEKRIPAHLRSRQGRVTLPATAAMVNLSARELLYDADNTLITWARHLAESRGLELAVDDRPTLDGWLLTNIDAVRYDPAADQMHTQLATLRRDMRRAVDRSPSRFYAGPCHAPVADQKRCQRPLYAWPDAKEIVCDGYRPPNDPDRSDYDVGCQATHTAVSRDEWLVAELEDALLPLAMWQEALPKRMPGLVWPSRSTWWRWVRANQSGRRMLEPRTLIDGVEFYRGGDVMDLCRREQPRIKGNAGKGRSGRMSA